jgi:hypothetical protein
MYKSVIMPTAQDTGIRCDIFEYVFIPLLHVC